MYFKGSIKLILLFIFFVLSLTSCKAQKNPPVSKKQKEAMQKALHHIDYQRYEEAAAELEKIVNKYPDYLDAAYTLGDVYRELNNYPKSKAAYLKVIQINPDYYVVNYSLGMLEFSNSHYKEAKPYLDKYLSYNSPDSDIVIRARLNAMHCEFAQAAILNPVPFEAVNLGTNINTSDPEYFPAVTADEQTMIFTRRVDNVNEDFFLSKKNEGEWQKAVNIGPPVNTPDNEGAVCISADGQYMFFTACNRTNGIGSCDIYISFLEGDKWGRPINVGPKINSKYWDSQPSISSDGRTLYFVSNRPGGYGEKDIWMSTLDSTNRWTDAVNLGPTINTQFGEFTPFIHHDGKTLYFSSEGHPGMGSMDIFLSRKDDSGKFGKPMNLGFPINTVAEESSLTVSAKGTTAYFASNNSKGNGRLDLYSFSLYKEAQPEKVAYLKGIISDAKTGSRLLAKIQLYDLETGKLVSEEKSNTVTGEYLVCLPPNKNYALNVSCKGYLFHSENFSLKEQPLNDALKLNVGLNKVKAGETVVLKNIFFETNSFALKDESQVELNKLMALLKENPALKIEIGGHTDNTGIKIQNQQLSNNRAKAVYDYLVKAGIVDTRLSYKGYAETKPIAENTTEEGRAKNRRTEFTVIAL